MGFLDFLKDRPNYSETQNMAKAMGAITAYKNRDFISAAKQFEEYFDMKGFGRFPNLDKDDTHMRINLMVSHFYAKQYDKCISVCDKLISNGSCGSDAYALGALSHYKVGNYAKAKQMWQIAKSQGNQIATVFDTVEDVRMQGYNN